MTKFKFKMDNPVYKKLRDKILKISKMILHDPSKKFLVKTLKF